MNKLNEYSKSNEGLVNEFLPKYVEQNAKKLYRIKQISSCVCKHSVKCQICKVTKAENDDSIVDKVLLHEKVRESGKYNFEGCKITVGKKFDTEFMKRMLGTYSDILVCELLKYGFPIGFEGGDVKFETLETWKYKNHKGAEDFPDDINSYLGKENQNSAILGPFKSNPFTSNLKVSPLNTVPKKDTSERRVILDLSMPKGRAINDYVDKNVYLNEVVSLIFPKVDDFIKLVKAKGQGCLMFKKDLRKAYRQIPICPRDYNLVAFCWKKHLFCDTVLSMGLSSAANICQRVTNAVAFMMFSLGIAVLNYLDDLAGVETKDNALFAYTCLGEVLKKCGLEESVAKASPPAEIMVFLGVLFNSITMTVEVTPGRLVEIKELVSSWLEKETATLKELQSLIGKLNYVAACVKPGRIFISRLLNWLRQINQNCTKHKDVDVPFEVKKDLSWWNRFLYDYNGISIMIYDDWSNPDGIFSTDACLTGIGGFCDGIYFHKSFPDFVLNRGWNICILELIAIIVAVRLWNSQLKGKCIVVHCDNEAVCQVINTGRARCPVLQKGLRELCYWSAIAQCQIRGVHIPGTENRYADCLSRWDQKDSFKDEFFKLTSGLDLMECVVEDSVFRFENQW